MKRLILIMAIGFCSCKKEKDGCRHCYGTNGQTKIICADTIANSFDEYTTTGIVHYECTR